MDTKTFLSQLCGDTDGNMSIHQCERVAKNLVSNRTHAGKITFDLVGTEGRKQCRWLDPHLGLFEMEGLAGFTRVSDVEMYHGLHIENMNVESADAAGGCGANSGDRGHK